MRYRIKIIYCLDVESTVYYFNQMLSIYKLQINWLENKMCHHLDDSYQPLNNYGNNNYAHCARIDWLQNKMCHHADGSYQLPNKFLSNVNYLIDSYLLPDKYISYDNYLDDSYQMPDKYAHYVRIKWLTNKIGLTKNELIYGITSNK